MKEKLLAWKFLTQKSAIYINVESNDYWHFLLLPLHCHPFYFWCNIHFCNMLHMSSLNYDVECFFLPQSLSRTKYDALIDVTRRNAYHIGAPHRFHKGEAYPCIFIKCVCVCEQPKISCDFFLKSLRINQVITYLNLYRDIYLSYIHTPSQHCLN
jgi:hypothetical protein